MMAIAMTVRKASAGWVLHRRRRTGEDARIATMIQKQIHLFLRAAFALFFALTIWTLLFAPPKMTDQRPEPKGVGQRKEGTDACSMSVSTPVAFCSMLVIIWSSFSTMVANCVHSDHFRQHHRKEGVTGEHEWRGDARR